MEELGPVATPSDVEGVVVAPSVVLQVLVTLPVETLVSRQVLTRLVHLKK